MEEYIKELENDLLKARAFLRTITGTEWNSLLSIFEVTPKKAGLVYEIERFLNKPFPTKARSKK